MGKLPGITHARAVRAFERAGFVIARQSGHVIMTKASTEIVIPRNNPINAITMYDIVKRSGLTVEEFRRLL